MNKHHHTNAWVGIIVFLIGVALVLFSFKLAYDIFTTPPELALNIKEGEPLNVNESLQSTYSILIKVILLVVMTAIGSVVANRGVKLYAAGSTPKNPPKKNKEKRKEMPETNQQEVSADPNH